MPAPPEPQPDQTYGQAMTELDELLAELEEADVDVDRLTDRVARGVELVRFCRARLDVVGEEVSRVMEDLGSAPHGVAHNPQLESNNSE